MGRTKDALMPLPGNAVEVWDTAMMDPSMPKVSNYRNASVLLLRTIAGFRELPDGGATEFELAPSLPAEWLSDCPRRFVLNHVAFQGKHFRLSYERSCEVGSGPGSLQAKFEELLGDG